MSTRLRIAKRYIPCMAGLLLLLLTLGATPALADTASFDLTISNGNILPPAASYGTVTLTLNGDGSIHVSVVGADGYGFFGSSGSMFGFNESVAGDPNINILNASVGVVVAANPNTVCTGGGCQLDGFGKFEFMVGGPTASSPLASFNFDVYKASGSFSTVYDLVELSTGGGSGQPHFAAHVSPLNGCAPGVAACTGWAGDGNPVPEPASMVLFGSGLLTLAGVIRRRRKS
jgi:hypothetical protein